MLEFLRKHQYGLMLVVAILVIIAFVFLYDKNSYGQGSGQRGNAFKIYGKGYDANHLRKLESYALLAGQLGMTDLVTELRGSRIDAERNVSLDFPLNLLILRKEGRDLGISPSNEEAQEEIQSMEIFAPGKRFDPTIFQEFSEELKNRGYQDADIIQVVKDKITLDKVKEMLAATFQPPKTEVEDNYARQYEKITAYALSHVVEDFAKDIVVTPEEISEYYEENKEDLLTKEKRKLEYVHFEAPVFPKPPPTTFPGGSFPGAKPQGAGTNPISIFNPKPKTEDGGATSLVPKPKDPAESTDPKSETEKGTEEKTGTEEKPGTEGGVEAPGAEPEGDGATDPAAVPEKTEEESADEGGCGAPQDEAAAADPVEAADKVTETSAKPAEETVEEKSGEEAKGATEEPADAQSTGETGETKPDAAEKPDEKPATPETTKPTPPVTVQPQTPTPGAPNIAPPVTPAVKPISPEEKKQINREFAAAVQAVYSKVEEVGESVDLAKVAEEYLAAAEGKLFTGKYAVTELFSADDAPDFIKDAQPTGRVVPLRLVFTEKKGRLADITKLPLEDRDDWLLFRVTEIHEPHQLTLEDATEQITETLKTKKTNEAVEAALKADAEKIEKEMAGKNSFKASADKLGIAYTLHHKFTGSPAKDPGDFRSYAGLIADTVPGKFSEPQISSDGKKGHIVYVAAKELEDAPDEAENRKLTIADRLTHGTAPLVFQGRVFNLGEPGYSGRMFKAWLERAYEEADPSRKL